MRWEDIEPSELAAAFEKANGELHIMRSFMASSNMPAAIIDQSGRILYCNNTAVKMWGASLASARGRTLPQVLDLSRADEERKQNTKVLRSRMPMVFFLLGANSAGKVISYSVFKFPFFCSQLDTLIGVFALPAEFKKTSDL